MKIENYFKRYELKYLVSSEQLKKIMGYLDDKIVEDNYPHSTIMNIYYDTDNYRLVRRSIEKPCYKEKLRLRSYCVPNSDTKVFLELKKKYDSVVYKRRADMSYQDALKFILHPNQDTQVKDELSYFLNFYNTLRPAVFLSYSRDAYVSKEDSSLRITFDKDITWRDYDVRLEAGVYGRKILDDGMALMEIKTDKAIPLWLTTLLSQEKIYQTSFSKYGNAYLTMIRENGGRQYE